MLVTASLSTNVVADRAQMRTAPPAGAAAEGDDSVKGKWRE
jgi:hypothetical protein